LALQGTLDTFSLPDVLRLLATTSKTGRLRIDGDRGQGSVWLTDGDVVDADAERAVDGTPTDEVLFELLRFGSGSFAFDADATAPASGSTEEVEDLLRRANSLLSEWSELETVVPSLAHQVSLATDLSADEVTIDADRWRSVVAVASGRTVGELATSLGLSELGVSRVVRDLVDLGVADIESPGAGAAAEPSVRAEHAGREVPRRPAPRPEPEGVGARGRGAPATGETLRAGWLADDRTGEIPAVAAEPRTASASNGQARAARDEAGAEPAAAPVPAPAPSEPPARGGLTSRLGRNRNPDAAPRSSEPTSAPPRQPSTNGTVRPAASPPVTPPARTNDAGPRARKGPADAGPPARGEPGRSRPVSPETPTRAPSTRGPGAGTPDVPPTSPFDGGRLGPSPLPDTGQIRPVNPSSLPPDLHWAADDVPGGTTGGGPVTGPVTSPFSGLSSLGPSRPAPSDGEIAPHVAAMSPEARSAVQTTVGNTGGSAEGRAPSQGDDVAQRGRLISFLSTVR
jgi:hypothetical protein